MSLIPPPTPPGVEPDDPEGDSGSDPSPGDTVERNRDAAQSVEVVNSSIDRERETIEVSVTVENTTSEAVMAGASVYVGGKWSAEGENRIPSGETRTISLPVERGVLRTKLPSGTHPVTIRKSADWSRESGQDVITAGNVTVENGEGNLPGGGSGAGNGSSAEVAGFDSMQDAIHAWTTGEISTGKLRSVIEAFGGDPSDLPGGPSGGNPNEDDVVPDPPDAGSGSDPTPSPETPETPETPAAGPTAGLGGETVVAGAVAVLAAGYLLLGGGGA